MIKSRLGELVIFYRRQRKSWQEAIKGNSVYAKELKQLIECPEEPINPNDLKPVKSLAGQLMPYEIQFNLSNKSDAADWIRYNK